jgi:hypothetical protein
MSIDEVRTDTVDTVCSARAGAGTCVRLYSALCVYCNSCMLLGCVSVFVLPHFFLIIRYICIRFGGAVSVRSLSATD